MLVGLEIKQKQWRGIVVVGLLHQLLDSRLDTPNLDSQGQSTGRPARHGWARNSTKGFLSLLHAMLLQSIRAFASEEVRHRPDALHKAPAPLVGVEDARGRAGDPPASRLPPPPPRPRALPGALGGRAGRPSRPPPPSPMAAPFPHPRLPRPRRMARVLARIDGATFAAQPEAAGQVAMAAWPLARPRSRPHLAHYSLPGARGWCESRLL